MAEVRKEDVSITCDNRNIAVTSGRSLSDYLKTKAYSEWQFGHAIHLHYADSRSCSHLQVADLVANAVYAHYDRGKRHFYTQLEPRMRSRARFPYALFSQ